VVAPWYERANATYITLVDENHTLSSLFNLVNVPSAVWIDESGNVRRIDDGTYATVHKMGDLEFGRNDYAPMVADWVSEGETSVHLKPVGSLKVAKRSDNQIQAEPLFKLGVYFFQQDNEAKANEYWQAAQALNPDSWNYARQDWSFTPEQANENWSKKFQSLNGGAYYRAIEGLDEGLD